MVNNYHLAQVIANESFLGSKERTIRGGQRLDQYLYTDEETGLRYRDLARKYHNHTCISGLQVSVAIDKTVGRCVGGRQNMMVGKWP